MAEASQCSCTVQVGAGVALLCHPLPPPPKLWTLRHHHAYPGGICSPCPIAGGSWSGVLCPSGMGSGARPPLSV